MKMLRLHAERSTVLRSRTQRRWWLLNRPAVIDSPQASAPNPLQPSGLPTAYSRYQELQEWPIIFPCNPWDDLKDTTINTEMGKVVHEQNMEALINVFRSGLVAMTA